MREDDIVNVSESRSHIWICKLIAILLCQFCTLLLFILGRFNLFSEDDIDYSCLFNAGEPEYALLESVLLLDTSVLLYDIWLYRDAYSSILLKGTLSRIRIALRMWHLVLVPFIAILIFIYGQGNELFQSTIIEVQSVVVGEFSIPPLFVTILVTYLSSIVVVVISFYQEIRKGLKRIDEMIAAGTPKEIVDQEQVLLIGRTGSSIRIKFLMFLLILGATTVTQLDFILQNYSIAFVVLLPILFLVLIPFISSRLVRGFQKMLQRSKKTKNDVPEILAEDL